jgi:hypothetical protein
MAWSTPMRLPAVGAPGTFVFKAASPPVRVSFFFVPQNAISAASLQVPAASAHGDHADVG